ncbi:hypothetical protein [Paracoccus fontiphilus]|uniref:Uncharacterized protein n=1 Tax=Paracoccus fontiphilus TaxID=1815556 RepID=A0ABV7IFI3_9RHOB|nr:hypothetical protein [Paracoccus fontiphilus]
MAPSRAQGKIAPPRLETAASAGQLHPPLSAPSNAGGKSAGRKEEPGVPCCVRTAPFRGQQVFLPRSVRAMIAASQAAPVNGSTPDMAA